MNKPTSGMFTHTLISQFASPESFQKGSQYVAQNRVLFAEVKKHDSALELRGQVKGTETYNITVSIYRDQEGNPLPIQAQNGHCTCPYQGEGWCKHLVAVALTELRGQAVEVPYLDYRTQSFAESWQKVQTAPQAGIENALFQLMLKRPSLRADLLTAIFPGAKSEFILSQNQIDKVKAQFEKLAHQLTQEEADTAKGRAFIASSFQTLLSVHKLPDTIYAFQQLHAFLLSQDLSLNIFYEQQKLFILELGDKLIPSRAAMAGIQQIFDHWARLNRAGKEPDDYWLWWTPFLTAFTADSVVAQFLQTHINGYAIDWGQFPGLQNWFQELGV